jgi:hypothetical protein
MEVVKMAKARLMNRPEDFEKFGIKQDVVEPFEDGIRNTDGIGNNEVWYFDGNFEDGSKVVIGFRSKTAAGMNTAGYQPNLNLDITRPDGTTVQEFAFAAQEDSSMAKDKCNVHFGPNYCIGDFKNYDIHIEGTATNKCDLHYHALTDPFRQGTSAMALGDHDEFFYTDLCVPKCEITGTLTYDGKTVEVHGAGYHDHQWMNITPFAAFHHWLWGRMFTEKYTVYIYDFVCSERFDFTRVPYFIVADNKTGKIVFETNGSMKLKADLEDMSVGKKFPKESKYFFDNGDKKAEFHVKWNEILEIRDTYGNAPANREEAIERAKRAGITDLDKVVGGTKEMFDKAGIMPSYIRFFADGGIKLTIDGNVTESSGTMIYEYNYVGREDDRAGVKEVL